MMTLSSNPAAAPVAAAAPASVTAPSSSSSSSVQDSIHHRLYEFAKSALIKIFAFPYATVCDLYCHYAADSNNWDDTNIGHYIGESSTWIAEALDVWENDFKHYTAEFCQLYPCLENLQSHLKDKGIPADIVCCMQHLQVSFETEEKARSLLQNISEVLKPGGYFLGITPDSSAIWTKYQKTVEASHNKGLKPNTVPYCIRSENYAITFDVEEEKFPLFGKKYQLKFTDGATSETHCLVHFPSLIRLAREAGLEFVEIQNLTEFYEDNRAQFVGMLHGYGANYMDPRGRLPSRAFDVLGLYATFVFQKPDPDAIPPIMTPELADMNEVEEWHTSGDEHWDGHADTTHLEQHNLEKGILGPGPADLRFSEPL